MSPDATERDARCIFCKRDSRPPYHVEHIFPVGIGGQDDLVLSGGEVCADCNGRLSRVDKFLVDAFAHIRPFFVSTTKRGKFTNGAFGDVRLARNAKGLEITMLEGEPGGCGDGFTSTADGDHGEVQLHTSYRFDTGVSRALHKIVLEGMCKFYGRANVLLEHFDVAREYAMAGTGGFRSVLVLNEKLMPKLRRNPHRQFGEVNTRDGELVASVVTVCGFVFLVTLHPDRKTIERIGAAYQNTHGAEQCKLVDEFGATRGPRL